MALGKGETMSKRLLLVIAMAFAIWTVGTGIASAARSVPGSVDPSFGVDGTAFPPPSLVPGRGWRSGPFGEDMAIGLDDGIFVVLRERECGSGSSSCEERFFVQRYQRDGAIDAGFGDQGRSSAATVISPNVGAPAFSRSASIAVTPENEVVVAALVDGRLFLFRFDRFGQLSSRFGDSGQVATALGGIVSQPRLAVFSDGRILVAVDLQGAAGEHAVGLARFMPDGSPDASFGAGLPGTTVPGVISIPAPSAAHLALSSGERIVLGGVRCCPGKRSSVFFGRRDSTGAPLAPFTSGRPWRNQRIGRPPTVSSVLALSGGRIAVVGSSGLGPFVLRVLPSGRRDRGFGRAGVVRFKRLEIGVSPAVADSAGSIYVAGHRDSGLDYRPDRGVVVRLNRRGRIDRRWGAAPPGYSLLPEWISEPLAMGFQSDGKLIVFGEHLEECIRGCFSPDHALTRLFTSRHQGR